MSTFLANTAIEVAVAAILTSIAALISAAANWLNTRSRMMEQGLQIADLQRQTMQLAAIQHVQATTAAPVSPASTIVTVPVPPAGTDA